MIRLYVPHDLAPGARLELGADQSHYLTGVMRRQAGDVVLAFNGRDGEWRALIAEARKKSVVLEAREQVREQSSPPDLELVVALVKRARLETIVEKAAELGARRVRLVITERTNADHAKVARLSAIAAEAAEQTGRLDVPVIDEPEKLDRLLVGWPAERQLLFCDEAGDAPPALEALRGREAGPWAVLIGPEGGFSPLERSQLRAQPYASPASLGPRILRADTAAIAALGLWQAALGDWRA